MVIIPKENEKDLKDLPSTIKKSLEIVPVDHMDEVLAHSLAVKDPSAFLQSGVHDLEEIYELPRNTSGSPTDVPHPAGVN
jgi:ATP-dependent Lon protease